MWIAIAHWLTAWPVIRSDPHAAPNRWTAAYLFIAGILEYALAANRPLTAYSALALLPILMVQLSLTLYHLSALQRRAYQSALVLLFAACMTAGRSLAYGSRDSGAVLLTELVVCLLTAIVLWAPVMKSPLRKQKHDETAWYASVLLMAPMVPLQASILIRGVEGHGGGFMLIYLWLAGLSVIGFIVYRFVLPVILIRKTD